METSKTTFPIDDSAILYLAQMGKDHTNTYRFTAELQEAVCPQALQKAVDRVYSRFPTIFAGFHPGFLNYTVVTTAQPPVVKEDTGLLRTMTRQEIASCAYRVLYSGNRFSIEAFHALADGYGAVMSLRALLAEYLSIRYGLDTPERQELLESGEPDWETELRDAYLDYADADPAGVPGRYSYQLPGKNRDLQVKATMERFKTRSLLNAAKGCGVSLTAMLSCVMAEAVMEVQKKHVSPGKEKPVRIMVPIDLRRLFPSKTLRNFILYALPGMEPEEAELSRQDRMLRFQDQLKRQVSREWLAPTISRNVRLQRSILFRIIPRGIKCTAMRIAYSFLGESNSSITLTNLGNVALSEEMAAHVRGIQVYLTPRRHSPYNCSLISCGENTDIVVTRFGAQPELDDLFFAKLRSIVESF